MYKYILFDLDGTLTDSSPGITNSVVYALKKFNIEVEDRTSLLKFIGPPLQDSFTRFYNFSKEDSDKAADYFREYYGPNGLFECEVYEGIEELLSGLKERNLIPILATSKLEEFAVRILKHFDLYKYFEFVSGAAADGSRVEKGDVINHAVKTYGITDLSSVVMIGDRKHDMIGAKKAGIDSIGVLYGYGDREELINHGATYIVENTDDILKIILSE